MMRKTLAIGGSLHGNQITIKQARRSHYRLESVVIGNRQIGVYCHRKLTEDEANVLLAAYTKGLG